MKDLDFYSKVLKCEDENDVFDYLINNLQPSISDWEFFVEWEKIKKNVEKIETELNILNSLIGKDNVEQKFIAIVKEYPKVKSALPILIAIRKQKLKEMPILNEAGSLEIENKEYLFKKDNSIDKKTEKELLKFFNESGLKKIFEDKTVKNIVDYCYGVEVGMDTNARKNRGGHNMEDIVEVYIKSFCEKNNFQYIKEVTAEKIKAEWKYDVPVDKSSRRYDFAIKTDKELIVFETNFYGGGGSKLKSTAGEYRNLFDVLNGKYKFVWITDGAGWNKTSRPLRETFNHNEYLFNLKMLEKGILEFV